MTEPNLSIHHIELALAQMFGVRYKIIVPNVPSGNDIEHVLIAYGIQFKYQF